MERQDMDGESFDRLSVVVHRLRDKATRRGALGLMLGGSIAAASGLLTEDAGARKHNRRHKNKKNKNCRGFGGTCSSNRDCCFSNCRSGRCWYGGTGGNQCGGRTCQSDWRCCSSNGISVCVPRNYPVCCGNQSFVNGYTCCGGLGGACIGGIDSCTGQFGVCCQPGWRHCNSGFFAGQCIPNDWDCNNLSQSSQTAGISAASTEPIPTTPPMPISSDDWIDLEP
jgi:hypothetical protein